VTAEWSDETALTVVMASKGYPGSYAKGTPIEALPEDDANVRVFHAGTSMVDDQLVAIGGRVLNVTALGKTVSEARDRAYKAVESVVWDGGFCRKDIGWRAVARENQV
jgi:phosphoribosylamine--glycine ligase